MHKLESTRDNVINNHIDLLNFSSYESALGFSHTALSKYYNDISIMSTISAPLSEQNNNTIPIPNYYKNLKMD